GNEGSSKPHSPASEPRATHPGSALDRDAISNRLLTIVQERTGYPAEMLRLDLDLEADLGIDSIKRVEILGSLRDSVPGLGLRGDGEVMDHLSRARTLGAIVERLGRELDGHSDSPAGANGAPTGPDRKSEADPASAVQRRLIEVVEAPLPP